MLKFVFSLALSFALLTSSATSASVVVDDFSSATDASLATVSRSNNVAAAFISDSGGFLFSNNGRLNYRVRGGGTFASLSSDFSNGISFSESASIGGSWSAFLFGGNVGSALTVLGNTTIGDGPLVFNQDISSFNRIQIRVLGFSDGSELLSGGFVGGSLSAVPEPTSLILVGLACAPVVCRRRRTH